MSESIPPSPRGKRSLTPGPRRASRTIRLSSEQDRELREMATADTRSANNWIRRMIEQEYARRNPPQAPRWREE